MSKLRCQPGDLAIITRCPANPSNIGRLVVVKERFAHPEGEWVVELCGPKVRGYGIYTRQVVTTRKMLCFDWNLTPISGEEPESVDLAAGVAHG